VIAVDRSAHLLHRLSGKAGVLGLADRVRTVHADLDGDWPAIDAVDLAWASLSMHRVADPDRVLTEVFSALRPRGLLAVVELDSFPRFLPVDVGVSSPGPEARCHGVLAQVRAAALPHLGSDRGSRLSQAGFIIEAQRTFAIDLTPPLPAATGRYAQASLRRIRSALDGRLSADDLATLDALLDSDGADGVRQRGDLTVRTARTVWVARRPGDEASTAPVSRTESSDGRPRSRPPAAGRSRCARSIRLRTGPRTGGWCSRTESPHRCARRVALRRIRPSVPHG
jgi:SAM-dependent methyltransferase